MSDDAFLDKEKYITAVSPASKILLKVLIQEFDTSPKDILNFDLLQQHSRTAGLLCNSASSFYTGIQAYRHRHTVTGHAIKLHFPAAVVKRSHPRLLIFTCYSSSPTLLETHQLALLRAELGHRQQNYLITHCTSPKGYRSTGSLIPWLFHLEIDRILRSAS